MNFDKRHADLKKNLASATPNADFIIAQNDLARLVLYCDRHGWTAPNIAHIVLKAKEVLGK